MRQGFRRGGGTQASAQEPVKRRRRDDVRKGQAEDEERQEGEAGNDPVGVRGECTPGDAQQRLEDDGQHRCLDAEEGGFNQRQPAEGRYEGLTAAAVNRLKRDFYACLDSLRQRQDWRRFSLETHALATEIFPAPPSPSDARNLQASADIFAASHQEQLTRLIDRLANEINLTTSTRDVDLLLAAMDTSEWPPAARRDVLVNYLGFPYWDLLTFPVAMTREPGEFREILVDRISPLDARTLSGLPGATLKGTGFANFAGFLSRAYRENDYLLGRLHAIDRLIDIICDAAGISFTSDRIDIPAFKKKAFAAVLDREARHLTSCGPLIQSVERLIRSL